MNIEDRYLSDEELALLILEVEENELVSAPPGFMEEVLIKAEVCQLVQNAEQEVMKQDGMKQEGLRQEDMKKVSAEEADINEEDINEEDINEEDINEEDINEEDIKVDNVKTEHAELCSKSLDSYKLQKKIDAGKENKIIEFQKYCIRVITSVAAAIAILFALPNAEAVEIQQVPTRQERIGTCVTREELLDDSGFLTKLMNGLNNKIGGFSNETETEK